MEEVQWDRKSFVQKPPPPGRGSSILGPILFVLVVSVAGGLAYLYIKGNGIPELGVSAHSETSDLTARLDEMNARLEQLEKRLRASPPPRSADSNRPSAGNSVSSASSSRPSSSEARARVTPPTPMSNQPSSPTVRTASPDVASLPSSSVSEELSSSEENLLSNREAWEATTNRLGDAVGELGDQRRELASTREALGQIQRNLERTYLSFDIRKEDGRQRIGPIWMDLRGVDRNAQRFTMRLFFDDRWVEVKDRVLGERLEFYIRGYNNPLEVVISDIQQDRVIGQLALPGEQTPVPREPF